MTASTRARLATRLHHSEGLRLKMYQDSVGKWTIGVGHNLSDKPISRRAVDVILEDDIADAERDLFVAYPWMENLNEVRQRVLVDMCFNLGITKLAGFKATLAHIQAGRWSEAAVHMLQSKWAEQVGNRALTLAREMETGQDAPE